MLLTAIWYGKNLAQPSGVSAVACVPDARLVPQLSDTQESSILYTKGTDCKSNYSSGLEEFIEES